MRYAAIFKALEGLTHMQLHTLLLPLQYNCTALRWRVIADQEWVRATVDQTKSSGAERAGSYNSKVALIIPEHCSAGTTVPKPPCLVPYLSQVTPSVLQCTVAHQVISALFARLCVANNPVSAAP